MCFAGSVVPYGPYDTSGRVVVADDHGLVDISFSDRDREVIQTYYGGHHNKQGQGLPPGLAKKDRLPPGIEKQLVRKGQLPPGLQYQQLPYDLERRLSRLPDDYLRVIVSGSVVLFNKNTNIIFDIVHGY